MSVKSKSCDQEQIEEHGIQNPEDKTALKERVVGLSTELKFYQDKAGVHPPGLDNEVGFPLLMSIEDLMSPLLVAYDMRVDELGQLMEQQGGHLDALIQRVEHLLADNQNLHNQISQGIHDLIEKDLPTNISRERGMEKQNDIVESEKKLRKIAEEKALLIQQCSLLKSELNCADKDITSRDRTLASLGHNIYDQVNGANQLRLKINVLASNKKSCEEKLSCAVSEMNACKERVDNMNKGVKVAKTQWSNLTARFEEFGMERIDMQGELKQLTKKVCHMSTMREYVLCISTSMTFPSHNDYVNKHIASGVNTFIPSPRVARSAFFQHN